MFAIHYQLDAQGRVVDSQGRVLVGLDGAAIQVAGLTTTAKRCSNSSVSTTASSNSSSCAKRGVKAGTVMRPKAPQEWAMDFPLCTIKEGTSAGTLWYCGEQRGNGGALIKRWVMFSDEERRAVAADKLEQLAWQLIEHKRASGSLDRARGKFLSRKEDASLLASLKVPPSVAYVQEQNALTAARRQKRRQQAKSQFAAKTCNKGVRKALTKTV